jgi:hypothetical protein
MYLALSSIAVMKKNMGEDVKKLKSLYIINWNVKWCSHFGISLFGISSKFPV